MKKEPSPKPVAKKLPEIGTLAGMTIGELEKKYSYDLYDDFLAFMDKFVIDHELGAFMTNVDRDGTRLNTIKNTWYAGRGIWVYSYLYNNLDKRDRYLDIADKAIQFILKTKPEGDRFWPAEQTREGEPILTEGQFIGGKYYPVSQEVSGDLFIANGLAEYSWATGKTEYWDMAKEIIAKCVRLFDRPDYAPNAAKTYISEGSAMPGGRPMGVWMLLLNITSQMLAHREDAELKKICDRSIDAILNKHYNPEYDMCNEVLNHDMTRPDNEYRHLVYTGHGIETFWMLMYEAFRRRDQKLFSQGEHLIRRHMEVAWDRVFGGFFRGLKNVYENQWILDKPLWTQEEALLGTLFVIEHTGAPWAKEWFARTFDFIQEKYPLKKHGLPLYDDWPDRLVTFVRHHKRVEIFHHPRHLMQNLVVLKNIIGRDGKITGVFS